MLRATLILTLATWLCFSGYCGAREQPAAEPAAQSAAAGPLEQSAPDLPALTLDAVAAAVHTGAVMLGDLSQIAVLDDAGCYVWQQPGVALVVTDVWQPGGAPQIWFAEEKLTMMFEHLPGIAVGEPVIYPGEPEDVDAFHIEPRVFVLSAEVSRRRLATYMDNLETWAGYNEGAEFIMPGEDELATDIGIVYLDSAGPLEFHFQVGEGGRLVLRHLVTFDFFSA
ncbi:MAG TPA: hypothetical protein ENO21_00025 [Firmicutes bacterium]|nr:hypothetical protein [Bacillota bacterium]